MSLNEIPKNNKADKFLKKEELRLMDKKKLKSVISCKIMELLCIIIQPFGFCKRKNVFILGLML
jgi:hypothetical protein